MILCQITSEFRKDSYAISLENKDFLAGSLLKPSNIRPNKLFTTDKLIILYKIGTLNETKIKEAEAKLIEIFTAVTNK